MKGTIELKNGIVINGETVHKLDYDTEEVTVDAYEAACAQVESRATGVRIAEYDSGLHFWLGAAAVAAVMPELELEDLRRLKGSDVNALRTLGRNFTIGADKQEEESSDEPSDSTADDSTFQ